MPRTVQQVDQRLAEVLDIHFDPQTGAPYWLARAKQMGLDPRREVRTISDLARIGVMKPSDLHSHGLEWFIPKRLCQEKSRLVVAQTGGTTGSPVWTAYSDVEFAAAFVDPFVASARHMGFPQRENWLYVGPSGPHIIGRAAAAIAQATGSPIPFFVDFDPRWANKLVAGHFSATRYLEHVIEQAIDVVENQTIGIIFSTPPVMRRLAERMSTEQRYRVLGVHYGGMPLSPIDLLYFQEEAFPGAVHLSGYGNTLFGCCLELSRRKGRSVEYFPFGSRLVFGICTDFPNGDAETLVYNEHEARGRILFSRLDETMLLLNVIERDFGKLVCPPTDAPNGFVHCGIASPDSRGLENADGCERLY